MPGDVFREYQSVPGSKTVDVLESGGRKRTLARGELTWQAGDQTFVIRRTGTTVTVTDAAGDATATVRTTAERPRK